MKRLPYNTVVVEQGTQADCTFFIKTGEVRVVRRMQADAEGTRFWAALRKDPLLGPKYAPSSTKHRRSDSKLSRTQMREELLFASFYTICFSDK